MAYTLTIQNSTGAPMTTSDGQTIAPDDSWESRELGNTYVHSDEFGSMSFRDLGDSRIGGDDGGTWGVLISYGGQHMVGRYEGGGHLQVTFNDHLQAEVGGMTLRRVHVNPLVAAGEVHAEHPAAQ
jgi:hypothetical protein